MTDPASLTRTLREANQTATATCLAWSQPTPDGWSYRCLCGFESRPDMSESDAYRFARMHEAAA